MAVSTAIDVANGKWGEAEALEHVSCPTVVPEKGASISDTFYISLVKQICLRTAHSIFQFTFRRPGSDMKTNMKTQQVGKKSNSA